LVAGRTGSGKSVFVQSIITSIVYHFTPDKCKLMIVDPKAVDFAAWDNIPHLITPVVTDAAEAVNALKWSVRDMEDRYKKLQKMGVRNIGEYNAKVASLRESGEVLTEQVVVGTDPETGEFEFETKAVDLSDMAYLVIIIDEVADLMTIARKDVEMCVQRLAQKARAAGIHLVMATQRPSADVITGVIKANFPTRISFQARSNIDSMTTLGEKGAEQLLPCGDMLFSEAGRPPVRVHGALIDNEEVNRVAEFLREQGEPEYAEGITSEEPLDGGAAIPCGGQPDAQAEKELLYRHTQPMDPFGFRHLEPHPSVGRHHLFHLWPKRDPVDFDACLAVADLLGVGTGFVGRHFCSLPLFLLLLPPEAEKEPYPIGCGSRGCRSKRSDEKPAGTPQHPFFYRTGARPRTAGADHSGRSVCPQRKKPAGMAFYCG